jgi:hypothetical protein
MPKRAPAPARVKRGEARRSLLLLLPGGSARLRARREPRPSIWQRASHPEWSSQQTILNRIERLLGSLALSEFDASFRRARSR